MNRQAYQPFNNYVSYERAPYRPSYQSYHHSRRPTVISEPMYGRQPAPMFLGDRGISQPGPQAMGQPVWWYEVEVFRDPHPIPVITRDPSPPPRIPYEYNRYRSTPFVTEVVEDDRHFRRRGDDFIDRIVPVDRYVDDGIYSAPPRARSVPLL